MAAAFARDRRVSFSPPPAHDPRRFRLFIA